MPTPGIQDLQFKLSVQGGQFIASVEQAGQALQLFNGQLATVNGQLVGMEEAMTQAGAASLSLQANIAAFGAIAQNIFGNASAGFRQYQESLADLRKVTGQLTEENLPEFEAALNRIASALPNTREELTQIGAGLAQLGFFAKDTEKTITGSASKIIELVGKVAVATDLSAQQAGSAFGVLRNLFLEGTETSAEAVKRLSQFADVANELSNTTAATAGYIIQFNTVVGATGKAAGLSFEQLSGYGAAIASLGISSAVAGTALQKLFLLATQKAAAFGKVVGITGDEFKKAFAADPNQAIIRFLEALNQQTSARRTELLTQIGLESRATTVVQGLANNVNILREAQLNANKASREGISLDQEVEKRLQTLQTQYVQFANNIQRALIDGFKPLAAIFGPVLEAINNFIKANPQLVQVLGTVSVVAAGLLTGVAALTLGFIGIKVAATGVAVAMKQLGQSVAPVATQMLFGKSATLNFLKTLYQLTGTLRAQIPASSSAALASLKSFSTQAVAAIQAIPSALLGAGVAFKTFSVNAVAALRNIPTAVKGAGAALQGLGAKVKAAGAQLKGFGQAALGAVGTIASLVVTTLVADAAATFSNALEDVNTGLKELGANATSTDLRKFADQGKKALDEYNNTLGGAIANIVTFGHFSRSREKDLQAISDAADQMANDVNNSFENFKNPPKFNNQPLTEAQKVMQEMAVTLEQTLGTNLEAREKTVDLISRSMTQFGTVSIKALQEIKVAAKLTDEQLGKLAEDIDRVQGRKGKNSLVEQLQQESKAVEDLAEQERLIKDTDEQIKSVREAMLKQRKDDITAIKAAGKSYEEMTNLATGAVNKELELIRVRQNAAQGLKEIEAQRAILNERLTDPTKTESQRNDIQAALIALVKEELAIKTGLNARIQEITKSETAYEKAIRLSVAALDKVARAAKKRQAETLAESADLAATEQQAVAIRRAALNIRLSLIEEEAAEKEKALRDEFKNNELIISKSIDFKNRLTEIRAVAAAERAKEADEAQQKEIKQIVDNEKKLREELTKERTLGTAQGRVVFADGEVSKIREIQKQIKEIAALRADETLKLRRIWQLQWQINDAVKETKKKYIDAQKALADFDREQQKTRNAELLASKEEASGAKVGALGSAIDVSKRLEAGEITKKQAELETAALGRKLQIETKIAEAKSDGITTDKEQDAITKARLKDAEISARASGQIRTAEGRKQLEFQKQIILEEDKIARTRNELTAAEEEKKVKEQETAKQRLELEKAVQTAKLQSEAAVKEADTLRLTNAEQLRTLEQEITAERQKQLDLAKQGASANAPFTAAPGAQQRGPNVQQQAPAVQQQAPPPPVDLANTNQAANRLTTSLTATTASITTATTTLVQAANNVGERLTKFADETTRLFGTVTTALDNLNAKVDEAVSDVTTIKNSLATVKG